MVFVDYQNLHLAAHQKFQTSDTPLALTHIDPLRLARLLVERRRDGGDLIQVHVYRGRPNPVRQPTAAAANDSQAQAWAADPTVMVHRRPLKYPRGRPQVPAEGKGIDVALAVDFVALAAMRRYDVGILVSSDSDLMPALETVVDLGLAHVEVAAWRRTARLEFAGTGLPWCHHLNEDDYLAVLDPTDYRLPTTVVPAVPAPRSGSA
jgi:uncharacterized LabA/DUF88 family protein